MSSSKGKFVWRELMSSDLEGARAFYGGLFGWSWSKMDMPNMEYWVAAAGPEMVCGLMSQMESPHPFWASYLGVDELDAAVITVAEAGGEVCIPPTDIPGTGRFSMVKDPTGANVMLFEGSDQGAAPGGMPGMHTFCWESLQTPDLEAAKAFYSTVVGWTYTPMGPEMALASAGADMVADPARSRWARPRTGPPTSRWPISTPPAPRSKPWAVGCLCRRSRCRALVGCASSRIPRVPCSASSRAAAIPDSARCPRPSDRSFRAAGDLRAGQRAKLEPPCRRGTAPRYSSLRV